MSIRVDTTSLLAAGIVVGNTGLGVLGSVIRANTATGTNGPGILYGDWDSSADDTKEFRALILTTPPGTLNLAEDGSLTYLGPSGTLTTQRYVDGVAYGGSTNTTFLIINPSMSAQTPPIGAVGDMSVLLPGAGLAINPAGQTRAQLPGGISLSSLGIISSVD